MTDYYAWRPEQEREPYRPHNEIFYFDELCDRIRWASRTFGASVNLRTLATRPSRGGGQLKLYSSVVVVSDSQQFPENVSFDYPYAVIRSEVIDVDELIERLRHVGLAELGTKPQKELSWNPLRCREMEFDVEPRSEWDYVSSISERKCPTYPAWAWRVRLSGYGPGFPYISTDPAAPLFQNLSYLIKWFSGSYHIATTDAPDSMNFIVQDLRGRLFTLDNGRPAVEGRQREQLTVKAQITHGEEMETLSFSGDSEIDLPAPDGRYHASIALIDAENELVDWINVVVGQTAPAAEIVDVIRNGETTTIEFKEWVRPKDGKFKDLEKCACAMANGTAPGRILLGVNDDGDIVWDKCIADFYKRSGAGSADEMTNGFKIDAAKCYGRWLLDELRQHLKPEPVITCDPVDVNGDPVLVVTIYPAKALIRMRNDDIWIRRGSSVRKPSDAELIAKLIPNS